MSFVKYLVLSLLCFTFFACRENKEKKIIEQDPDYQGIVYDSIPKIRKAINADVKSAQIAEIIQKKVDRKSVV